MSTGSGGGAVWVTGLGVVCSIGSDLAAFEAALRRGHSGIRRGENGSPPAAPLSGFDLAHFLESYATLPEALGRQARRCAARSPLPIQAAVAASLQAWQQARLTLAPIPPERIALVVAGHNLTGQYTWQHRDRFEANPAYLSPRFALHFQDTDHVGTLSEIFGIRGEGFTVGAASASGNAGIVQGSRLVEVGAADACLVVGALADLSPLERRSFLNLGAHAADISGSGGSGGPAGAPFDRDHGGFVYGQGAACLVLEAEASARSRGCRPLAQLAGYDLKLAAHALAAPSWQAEARVMTTALERAHRAPDQVDYVNAHGTAAPRGDEAECRALDRIFGALQSRPWVNSTKGLVGHCLGAAGVLEAVATVLQMNGGFVHPNLHLESPINSNARFAGSRAEPAEIRVALSNSFGFGGFNSSVVLVKLSSLCG